MENAVEEEEFNAALELDLEMIEADLWKRLEVMEHQVFEAEVGMRRMETGLTDFMVGESGLVVIRDPV
jgi:hypothetical protein